MFQYVRTGIHERFSVPRFIHSDCIMLTLLGYCDNRKKLCICVVYLYVRTGIRKMFPSSLTLLTVSQQDDTIGGVRLSVFST